MMYAAPGGLDDSSSEAFVKSLAKHPLVAEPGTRWIYSYSFEVVGRLIELASGRPLDAFLEDEIFAPLGMEATGFTVPAEAVPTLAGVHRWDGTALSPVELHEDVTRRPQYLRASGGLYSTAGDYLRFARLLLAGGELEGRRLLSESTVAALRTDQMGAIPEWSIGGVREPGSRFGLGVALIGDPAAAGHPGAEGAFYWAGSLNTFFVADPEWRTVMILFTQYAPFRALPIEPAFRAAVYRALAPPPDAER